MKSEIPMLIETITPATAQKYLDSMVQNRACKSGLALSYAISMEDGEWALNGETIKFNDKGQMIDGQHRCEACILAGKPFTTYVARDVSDARAFATIDTGAVRTYGDLFSIAGVKNANNTAAAAQIVYLYKTGKLALTGIIKKRDGQVKRLTSGTKHIGAMPLGALDKKELLEYAAPFVGALQTSLHKAVVYKSSKMIPVSLATALHFLFSEKSPAEADRFIEDLGSGAGLADKDPVLVLRNKLIASVAGHASFYRNVKIALCIMAWNKRRQGEKSKLLKLIDGAGFPKII